MIRGGEDTGGDGVSWLDSGGQGGVRHGELRAGQGRAGQGRADVLVIYHFPELVPLCATYFLCTHPFFSVIVYLYSSLFVINSLHNEWPFL